MVGKFGRAKKAIGEFAKDFVAIDNTRVNTAAVFACIGFVAGLSAFIYYAFVLQQDIGSNLTTLASGLMGLSGGSFVASLFSRR